MWPLFATAAAYAMNNFASEALGSFLPFQLVHQYYKQTQLSSSKISLVHYS